jgi:hypothetical protein
MWCWNSLSPTHLFFLFIYIEYHKLKCYFSNDYYMQSNDLFPLHSFLQSFFYMFLHFMLHHILYYLFLLFFFLFVKCKWIKSINNTITLIISLCFSFQNNQIITIRKKKNIWGHLLQSIRLFIKGVTPSNYLLNLPFSQALQNLSFCFHTLPSSQY